MKLSVDGMTCQGCVGSVSRVITRQTELPEADIKVSLETNTAEFKDVEADKLEKVIDALTKAGFPAKVLN